ncbi:hypothetical protein TRVA0_034S00452 [Trichomonascus vanleenenianus]|uniref:uncharacterized protein n=1 Tax=Trichomonascus vanleenenianus TaxID=2268995 RepID=UPI003ECA136C
MAETRQVISDEQKLALREYQAQHRGCSASQIKEWFRSTYDQTISAGTVSRILNHDLNDTYSRQIDPQLSEQLSEQRRTISYQQKLALREYKAQHRGCPTAQIQAWFSSTFDRRISAGTVSKILNRDLNDTYARRSRPRIDPELKGIGLERWPAVEEALYNWLKQAEDITITSNIVREKARQLWKSDPSNQGKKMPLFSAGWLRGFQKRYSVNASFLGYGAARGGSQQPEAEQYHRAISYEQRCALREYKDQHTGCSIAHLQEWFWSTYNRTISGGTVSKILNRRYVSEQPEAERGVSEQVDSRRSSISEQAEARRSVLSEDAETERTIEQTEDDERAGISEPVDSRRRWIISEQDDTRRSIGQDETRRTVSDADMERVRWLVRKYNPRDVYNCNETGFSWKLVPEKSSSTSIAGSKKDNARMTVHFCCNMDGSDTVPLWVIGTAKKPRAFSAEHVDVRNLDVVYRSNNKAWMTSGIFGEWLRWFDSRLGNRKVLLIMDTLSAHEVAVDTIRRSGRDLKNIVTAWLPHTSRCQPLDQGIIQAWKAHWRRRWVVFLLHQCEAGNGPLAKMNFLLAIRWAIDAWEEGVTAATIQSCFRKALVDVPSSTDVSAEICVPDVLDAICTGIRKLQNKRFIREVMDLNDFLNPADEDVVGSRNETEEQIMVGSQFEESDDEEELEQVSLVSHQDALAMVRKLRLYQEQRGGNTELIRQLNSEERLLKLRQQAGHGQRDIRSYFM